jgi:membrane protein required for colicin V production
MNWLDWLLIALLLLAAFKGYSRGFIVEVCSLLALVMGIWVAARFSLRFADAVGLGSDKETLAFLLTFLAVLVAVHLLARFLTTLIDLAQLGIPNKLAGTLFGALRSAFTLSIMLNLLAGWSDDAFPPRNVREESTLHAPLTAFAPLLIPALGETKWVKETIDRAKEEAEVLFNEQDR